MAFTHLVIRMSLAYIGPKVPKTFLPEPEIRATRAQWQPEVLIQLNYTARTAKVFMCMSEARRRTVKRKWAWL